MVIQIKAFQAFASKDNRYTQTSQNAL